MHLDRMMLVADELRAHTFAVLDDEFDCDTETAGKAAASVEAAVLCVLEEEYL